MKKLYDYIDTEAEAQAEYNRIKTILGVKC